MLDVVALTETASAVPNGWPQPATSWSVGVRVLLSPALIGVASAITRRQGPEAGGWFAALPLTSGPLALVLTLEQGAPFAAEASAGVLLAIVALVAYAVVYAWSSLRTGWLASSAVACITYLGGIWLLGHVRASLVLTFVLACGAVVVAHRSMPREHGVHAATHAPVWDIPVRMAVAAVLVWVLAHVAGAVGPRSSGLLAPFPVAVTILSAFTHHHAGPATARRLLRSLLGGLVSFAVFFLVVGALLPVAGTARAFATATLGSLATHAVAWRLVRDRRPHIATQVPEYE